MGMIAIGRVALPVTLLLMAASLIVALFVSSRSAGAARERIDSALYCILIAGVTAARLSFVVAYWDVYRLAPFSILDIRDGGFHPWAGVMGGGAVAFAYAWRNSSGRRALALALIAATATAGIGIAAAWALREPAREIGLPAGTFTTLDGSSVQFASFVGKPVVINLWASWCPPCRREMPVLEKAQAQNRDVVFVFANQGESAAAARAYLAKEGFDIQNVLLDSDLAIGRHVRSAALPTTLFFDSRGKLVKVRMGEVSAASLSQQLEPLRGSSK